MSKKHVRKVSKAAVIAALASGTIAYTLPTSVQAASPFSDVDPSSSHYDNIIQLYELGYVQGFRGKYMPNQSVTRAQAAKMLAQMLQLDTTNVKDPGYTDVSHNYEMYPYIAALAEANIMTGYKKKFQPYEPVTRSQMAKMLVLGYNFDVASSIQPRFIDVDEKTSNAVYIQSLVDMGITRGTTHNTYSPYKPVTRAQMATFLITSDKVSTEQREYKITNIDGNTVYINGVAYKVGTKLKPFINNRNANVLKGATIEGVFRGKELVELQKLTINASGASASRMLTFDGDYETLQADVVINGNHILFRNMYIQGHVLINETVRPPLTQFLTYSQRQMFLTEGFATRLQVRDRNVIDWGNGNQSEMNPVEKNIRFENAEVARMTVSQNKTRITTDTVIGRLEVIGEVQEIEVIGDVNYFHVNNATPLTIFGEGHIKHMQYDSLYDLQIYYEGTIDKLVVDNIYGWIDLGEYTYIEEVILPVGESPNNIFDDYLEDHTNITVIEDSDGNPVDKDPIENQKPSDRTPPVLKIVEISAAGTNAEIKFSSNERGTYYYIVQKKEKDMKPPSGRDLIEQIPGKYDDNGTGAMRVGENSFTATGLAEKETYVVYIIGIDGSKNVSSTVSQEFQLKDATPPRVNHLKATPLHGGQRAGVTFTASEPGDYYIYYRPKTTGQTPATFAEIKANAQVTGKAKADKLVINETLTGLTAETEYEVYVAMIDLSGNESVEPQAKTDLTTSALDNVPPYVTKPLLTPSDRDSANPSIFYVPVSEALDKETAEDVTNYRLTGAAMVNIPSHDKDGVLPKSVKYIENRKVLAIEVPGDTGLVNYDNIVFTVLPGVKDLAFNDFENEQNIAAGEKPRNFTEYIHTDATIPKLTLDKVQLDEANRDKALATFTTDKAGTYYYMIMPKQTDMAGITSRDFYDEFVNNPSGKFQDGNKNKYVGDLQQPAPAMVGTQTKAVSVPASELDPFVTYSLFMIVRDRSGNLSQIVQKDIVQDTMPPQVTVNNLDLLSGQQGKVKPLFGDRTAEMSITSDEAGYLYYVIEEATGPNDTGFTDYRAHEVKAKGKRADLNATTATKVLLTGLSPHKYYKVYIAVEDAYGNLTMKEQSHKNNGQPVGTENPNAQPMHYFFLSDGTLPTFMNPLGIFENGKYRDILERADGMSEDGTNNVNQLTPTTHGIIVRQTGGKDFKVTFSEAIAKNPTTGEPVNSWSELSNFINISPAPQNATLTIPQDNTGNVLTWQPYELLLTYGNEITADITLTVTGTDIANYKFKPDIAKYRIMPTNLPPINLVEARLLNPTNAGSGSKNTSKELRFLFESNMDVEQWRPKLYYATTTTDVTTLTPTQMEQVVQAVEDKKQKPTGIIAMGDMPFTPSAAVDVSLPSTTIDTFIEGQRVHVISKDMYGNLRLSESNGGTTNIIK